MDREDLKYYLKQLRKPLSLLFLGVGFGLIMIIVFLLWLLSNRAVPQVMAPVTASPTPIVTELPNLPNVPLPTDQPVAPAPALPVTYVVNPGDSTWRIAQAFYGNGQLYTLIEAANNLPSDAWLSVGQELLIPDADTFQPDQMSSPSFELTKPQAQLVQNDQNATAPMAEPGRQFHYTVERNDSLWFIALKHLGNGQRWVEIYSHNKTQIANPDLIYPGQVLIVPED